MLPCFLFLLKRNSLVCSDSNGINDFFDKLVHIEHLAKKIFLGVLITLAILAMVPMAYREYRAMALCTRTC